MRFTYTRGSWSDGCVLADWSDDEDFEKYLQRLNFNHLPMEFGEQDTSQIQIYESENNEGFLAHVCLNGGRIYEVYLPEFPSLMMFIKDHAAAFSVNSANYFHKEMLNIIEKFFQSEHGHNAYEVCHLCDPVEWNRRISKSK